MGNRSSSTSTPPPKAPSVKEKKRTPVRRSSTPSPRPTPRARQSDPSKKTPVKQVEKEKTARRTDRTPSSDTQEQQITPIKKKRDEVDNRTAKETRSKESQKKRKSAVYIDGNLVSKDGAKKKPTSRSTPNKTSSLERKKKEVVEKKGGSERSKRKHSSNKKSEDQSAEKSVDQTAEKTQDSSGRRRRAKAKSVEAARSTEDETKKTEKTETEKTTEKTKEEKTVPEFGEDDNTLVSDNPKRKKYSDDKEANVRAFIKHMLGKGVQGLKEEFVELKKEIILMKKDEIVEAYSEFSQPINAPKNRYKDVPRLNESKVVLNDRPDDQSYIHANYCTTPKREKRFICTQGPNETTYNDFWTMIYQEEVEFIVMLCNFLEMGKPKCDKYLPMDEGEMFSTQDFTIECQQINTWKFPESVKIRKLMLTKKGADKEQAGSWCRDVHHVHWETWPDRGVPPIDLSIFKLLKTVGVSKKPIVVHCSAGIGRTGTMVVVQIAMEMLRAGQSLAEGLSHVLRKLRKQRAMSVQNENQYVFIHRVLLDHFRDAIDEDEIAQFCADYEKLAK